MCFFFFKQKKAYEMRISDWSSDVCSSDLEVAERLRGGVRRQLTQVVDRRGARAQRLDRVLGEVADAQVRMRVALAGQRLEFADQRLDQRRLAGAVGAEQADAVAGFEAEADVVEDGDPLHLLGSRSEEHTSELQSLMRISYAVFCLKKKKIN